MSLLTPLPASQPIPPPAPRTHAQTARAQRSRHLRAVETPARRPVRDAEVPPPPEAAVQRLALYAFEAVEGFRPIAGLGRLVAPAAIEDLQMQRRARIEQRTLYGDTRRVVPTPGPAHLSRPRPLVLESVVVLRAVSKSVAVAIRFEFALGRWQAAQVTVL